jgi:hypothetical protein
MNQGWPTCRPQGKCLRTSFSRNVRTGQFNKHNINRSTELNMTTFLAQKMLTSYIYIKLITLNAAHIKPVILCYLLSLVRPATLSFARTLIITALQLIQSPHIYRRACVPHSGESLANNVALL